MEALYRVGTSGFSFDDWVGPVYPEKLSRASWLSFYKRELGFDTMEVNYTYYQMPAPRTIEGLVHKTSAGFRFTVKVHRSMTHDILQPDYAIQDNPGAFDEFRKGLRPLIESGKLGCVLAQFPYAFIWRPENEGYLDRVIERLRDLGIVVEFRHRSWVRPETFEFLRKRGAGLCAVDEPELPKLMPWTGEATSGVGYARFHGRNAKRWFGGSTAERYDYLYTDEELRDLAGRVMGLAGKVR